MQGYHLAFLFVNTYTFCTLLSFFLCHTLCLYVLNSGNLKYKYLVPGGPYEQLWDWDSFFTGVALLEFGSRPYLAGSMMNFLEHTNLTDGTVEGCLVPDQPPQGVIYHAKPLIIQGAYLSVDNETINYDSFFQFELAMIALLEWWDRAPQKDPYTGLFTWHDQLQSGADNLVLSECPSYRSPECWNEKSDANTLASAELQTFLAREHIALSLFYEKWLETAPSSEHQRLENQREKYAARSRNIISNNLETQLWNEEAMTYLAKNVSLSGEASWIKNRVYVMGIPLWGNLITNATRINTVASSVLDKSTMLSEWGIRSTSKQDLRYNNDNEIKPYSNWRGPIWVNANAMIIYGLAKSDSKDLKQNAIAVADAMVHCLAEDLRITGTWHEGYSGDTGEGLAADGFLSWNTLAVSLSQNARKEVDPFLLA